MRVSASLVLLTVASLLAAQVPAKAHHHFSAAYDSSRPILLRGIVTKVAWSQPHAKVYVDTKGERGAIVNWLIETEAPNVLVELGWPMEAFAIGAVITIEGYPARNGNPVAHARTIALADGRRLVLEGLR